MEIKGSILLEGFKEKMFDIKYDPLTLTKDEIPSEIGLYAWFSKLNGEIVYIGKSTGKKGLRQRIYSQHLNPKYLECRSFKFTQKDTYQTDIAPLLINGKVHIDKSSFRKTVARLHSLTAGEESVIYLCRNFNVAFASFSSMQKDYVIEIESRLIKEIKPKYNNVGK